HVRASLCVRLCLLNAPAPPEIYTLSLHDALPIYGGRVARGAARRRDPGRPMVPARGRGGRSRRDPRPLAPRAGLRGASLPFPGLDRKSTRLNSSHVKISYAVFCLKKKKQTHTTYA